MLYKFWILTPYPMYWRIWSLILWLLFLFCWFPLLCKDFLAWCVPFVYLFSFFPLPEEIYQQKILLQAITEILLSMFSSRIFMVSGLTFKSLIHFEFILVCDIRRYCNFIFLYIPVHFPNTTYWINYLNSLHVLASSVEYQLTTEV